MIPSLSSLLPSGNSAVSASAAPQDSASMPLPLVPAFVLGSLSPMPSPVSPPLEESMSPGDSDPEQLMLLLLDAGSQAPTALPPLQLPVHEPIAPSLPQPATCIDTPVSQAEHHVNPPHTEIVSLPDTPQMQATNVLPTQTTLPVNTPPLPVMQPYGVSQQQTMLPVNTPPLPVMQPYGVSQQQTTLSVNAPPLPVMQPYGVSQQQTTLPVNTPPLPVMQPYGVAQIHEVAPTALPQMQAARSPDARPMQAVPQFNASGMPLSQQDNTATLQVEALRLAPQPVTQPELTMAARAMSLPPTPPAQMLAGQVVMPAETAPLQPFKLRTPKDAREASKQALALMQAQPGEPLTKILPPQLSVQTQQLLHINHPASQPSAPTAPLKLPENQQGKAAALKEALGERLQMQVDQRSQKATIRLDPPNLGKLDISLHYEGGKLQVQIQAAQPEVYRALQLVSQELRGALIEQNQVAVNVQISQQQGEQRHAPRQQHTQDTVLNNNVLNEVAEEQRHRDLSILTTV